MTELRILCVGDIVGQAGRQTVARLLPDIKKEYDIHFTIGNIENAAAGFGFTKKVYDELLSCGIDAFTGGNHIFDKKDVLKNFDDFDKLARPLNLPAGTPGEGIRYFNCKKIKIAVVNLIGRVFMGLADCPFRTMESHLTEISGQTPVIIVDFHCEATSEKQALGWYLDGRVSAVFGTHTHVMTADEQVTPAQTAYITDIGMTGSHNSVIGMEKETVIQKFTGMQSVRFEPSEEPPFLLNGIMVRINAETGKALEITRIRKEYTR